MIFIGDGIGAVFIVLGLFLVLSGLRRRRGRNRAVDSGIGAVLVGIGNVLLTRNLLPAIIALVAGVVVIVMAARLRD